MDESVQATKTVQGGLHSLLDACLIGGIGLGKADLRAQFPYEGFPAGLVEIGNKDLGPAAGQQPNTRGAQTRTAAAYQERMVLHLHKKVSSSMDSRDTEGRTDCQSVLLPSSLLLIRCVQ